MSAALHNNCPRHVFEEVAVKLPGGKLFSTVRALWQSPYRVLCLVEGFRYKMPVLLWVSLSHVSK